VTVPLVSMTGTVPTPQPLGNPDVTGTDQVLLAAAQAAAAAANQGYAEVRGGVTYFNPQAQHLPVIVQPGVSKRPKAAIPIVDPSQISMEDVEEHLEINNLKLTNP